MSPAITTDADTVAEILTEAFTGDPLMHWLFPGVSAHVEALGTWWAFLVAKAPEGAERWLAHDGAAAALWYPPHDPSSQEPTLQEPSTSDAGEEVETDGGDDRMDAFLAMVGGLVGDRLPAVLELFGRIRDAHPAEPHWYLAAVGTRPASQGQGSGAAVLAPVLERCDSHGLPAYLESSNPRNLAFYHRLGFDITGEIHTPDGRAHLTAMWRDPR